MYAKSSSIAIAEHAEIPDGRITRDSEVKSGPRSKSRPLVPRQRSAPLLLELVEAKVISRSQLENLMSGESTDGRRLTTRLVDGGFATETQITQVASQQFSAPWISLSHVSPSREILSLVSCELAEKHCLIPLFVRSRPREVLYVAIDDPGDEDALHEVGEWVGLPLRALVALPTSLRAAIRECYGSGMGYW